MPGAPKKKLRKALEAKAVITGHPEALSRDVPPDVVDGLVEGLLVADERAIAVDRSKAPAVDRSKAPPRLERSTPPPLQAAGNPQTGKTRPVDTALASLLEPALDARDLVHLEVMARESTPEEFQKHCSVYFRKLLVKGLAAVPVPRTIKEIQAVMDMIRKAEGLEKKDKDGGMTGLVIPRVVSRRPMVVVDVESGSGGLGVPDMGAPEPGSNDSEIPSSSDTEFEV